MASYLYLVMVIMYLSTWCNPINGGKKCTKKDMDGLKKKLDKCCKDRLPHDCSDIPDFTGVTSVHPEGCCHGFRVYCKKGWTYIAHRYDGSKDFYQPWQVYRDGFGNPHKEHFIGLDNLVCMLLMRKYKLRIELTTWPGPKTTNGYADYATFDIADARDNFCLTAEDYSGTAGDSLYRHHGHEFSTFDRDNDIVGVNCAQKFHGAWWYKDCHSSNLFGRYSQTPQCSAYAECVVWRYWPEKLGVIPPEITYTEDPNLFYSFKKVEMMIRPL